MDNILFYIIFPVGGFALIILSLAFNKYLGQRQVIDLESEKFGLTLKANAFGLVVLIGSILIAVTVIYLFRGYESIRSRVEIEEEFMADLDERLKRLDVTFKLKFPSPAPPNPRERSTNIAVWVQRKDESEKMIYEKTLIKKEEHGILLTIQELGLEDIVSVCVKGQVPYMDENGDTHFTEMQFESDDITIPVVHLNMEKVEE